MGQRHNRPAKSSTRSLGMDGFFPFTQNINLLNIRPNFRLFFFSTHAFLAALSGILMRIQLRNTANITFFFSSHRFPCPVEALSSGQTFKTLSSHGQQNKPHHPSATGNQSPDNPNISPDPFPSTLLLGYSPNSNLPRRLQHPAGATGIGFLRPLPVICR
jgi:hypothetical protein